MQRREILPLTDNVIWEIQSGFLRSIVWDSEANVTTLGIWGPGEQVSAAFCTIQPLQIECLLPAQLCRVESQMNKMSLLMFDRAQRSEELLYLCQIRCTQTRLRGILMWLGQRFGQATSGGMLLPIRLTHLELAELIGSTRATITRLMNRLQSEGEIEILEQQLLIRNLAYDEQFQNATHLRYQSA